MTKNFHPMPFLWSFKSVLVLIALVFGLCYTLPTFFPRFVHTILPSNKINLGLDLKGGLTLTLNVEVQKAVKKSMARALTAAEESAASAGVATSTIHVD